MKRASALVGVSAMLLMCGCSASTPKPTPTETVESAPATLEAELSMSATPNKDGTVSVAAESNLPDGTELGAMVFEEGGFMAQDSQVLQDGFVEFTTFSDQGGPIPAGSYEISVTMPIASNQPDDVRAVIGETGENLTGPLVSENEVTGDAVVSVSEELVIP